MVYSIVDLGSNTIRLCVYDVNEKQLKRLFDNKIVAGLANYIVDGKLSKKGITKACEVLQEFKYIMDNLNIASEETRVFATASLRNIINSQKVMRKIFEETGLQVELLSGEEEATLGFIGANTYYELHDGILIDIGGGSTEVVVFHNKQIEVATSIPIGSLNLYVKYASKLVPKQDERNKMRTAVLKHLASLDLQTSSETIYGVGGTLRAACKLNNAIYKRPTSNKKIAATHIPAILNQLINSKRKTLSPITQHIPDRIHTIIPGMIIMDTVVQHFNSKQVMVSPYALREGYMFDRIIKGADE